MKFIRSRFFIKFFLLFLLSIILITITVTYILSSRFETVVQDKIMDIVQQKLEQNDFAIASLVEDFNRLALEIFFDPAIKTLFAGYKKADREDFLKSINQMRFYQTIYPQIHSIYFYNAFEQEVYSTLPQIRYELNNFFDREAISIFLTAHLMKETLIPRIIPSLFEDKKDYCYTVFIYDKSETQFDSHNVIMINIKAEYVSSYIKSIGHQYINETFFINNQGTIMISDEPKLLLTKMPELNILKEVISGNRDRGYIIAYTNNTKKYIPYIRSKIDNCFVVQIFFYDEIFEDMIIIRKIVVIICTAVMFISFVLSIAVSLKLSQPIDALKERLGELLKERNENIFNIQQQFFRLITCGGASIEKEEIVKRLNDLKLDINLDAKYCICLFIIDNLASRFPHEDYEYIPGFKYGIIKTIESELTIDRQHYFFVDIKENELLFVINDSYFHQLYDNNYEFIKHINSVLNKKFNITLSSILDKTSVNPFSMKQALNRINKAKLYRFIKGIGCIIDTCDLPTENDETFKYPQKYENLLLNALRQGNICDSLKYYNNIISIIRKSNSPQFAYFTLQSIAISIILLMNSLKQTFNGIDMIDSQEDVILKVNSFETLNDAERYFENLFRKIATIMSDTDNGKNNLITNKVIDIIRKEYSDPNLSLTMISERLGLSSVYLGKIFKQVTGISATKCINNYRLEKAAELLKTTNKPIKYVSEATGYSSLSYFSTVFKSYFAVSPNEYRCQNR